MQTVLHHLKSTLKTAYHEGGPLIAKDLDSTAAERLPSSYLGKMYEDFEEFKRAIDYHEREQAIAKTDLQKDGRIVISTMLTKDLEILK